jgi:trehalose synthase
MTCRERAVAFTMALLFPELSVLSLNRYAALLGPDAMRAVTGRIGDLRATLDGRVVWNISATAAGGGVAEMVRSLLAYARGAGVDARWAVIEGSPEFFRITKRLHNAIHGSAGDGSPLGPAEARIFEHVALANAAELAPMVRPGDVVIVHDPQPAAMIPSLIARGAHILWRCHIGQDEVNEEVVRGWQFVAPYLADAHAYVFSRTAYIVASGLDARRSYVIPPTIDPFSVKNQPLDESCVRATLAQAQLILPTSPITHTCTFLREDGSPGRCDRIADVVREGPPPLETTPLVVQVSRWDRLKDPIGVLRGFLRLDPERARGAHLMLAGPATAGVADDPEGARVLGEVIEVWRHLPLADRQRIHLATLPTIDVDENAAMVNALQRHATIIVQKSLHEGFGLTVTEAMWKAQPVVASAVGGIQDQIDDGEQGLLLRDPTDLDAFAGALATLLGDPVAARNMGARGHARVLERYLGLDSLLRYGALIERLDGAEEPRTDLGQRAALV